MSTYIRDGKISGEVVHERNGVRFIWDRGKADYNLKTHGVRFEAASEVFFDPFVQFLRSEMLGGEEREVAIGMNEGWHLLVVVYTFRKDAVRIISARRATPAERKDYEDSASA